MERATIRQTRMMAQEVWETPYRDWPHLANALGWRGDMGDPAWMDADERGYFWRTVELERESAVKARQYREATAEVERALRDALGPVRYRLINMFARFLPWQ